MRKGNKNGNGIKKRGKPYDQKKVLAIKKLAVEFNYTEVYIRQCLRGDSAALVADDIKKRYGVIYQQLENALA